MVRIEESVVDSSPPLPEWFVGVRRHRLRFCSTFVSPSRFFLGEVVGATQLTSPCWVIILEFIIEVEVHLNPWELDWQCDLVILLLRLVGIIWKSNFATLDEKTGIVTSRRADRHFEEEGPILCSALDGMKLPSLPQYEVRVSLNGLQGMLSLAAKTLPLNIVLDRVVLTSTGVLLGCWQCRLGSLVRFRDPTMHDGAVAEIGGGRFQAGVGEGVAIAPVSRSSEAETTNSHAFLILTLFICYLWKLLFEQILLSKIEEMN
ncbi:2,3-bisphosphoglycerate-independent phosphoglycerate mutase [Senna tora]|uniref:2,3-bisphosphoglycerate-independent phosphoglycerate mutase n=1 Tax=Senna tora TaxID=362788 RepID=A0A834T0Z7_9FABA|nr:2,3-bisphosphoglycerate-independent phosphoglycerate mutase [Senna tora]